MCSTREEICKTLRRVRKRYCNVMAWIVDDYWVYLFIADLRKIPSYHLGGFGVIFSALFLSQCCADDVECVKQNKKACFFMEPFVERWTSDSNPVRMF